VSDLGIKLDTFRDPVRGVLRKYSAHVLPLSRTGSCDQDAAAAIQSVSAPVLFPWARAAEAALSGLFLLVGCWDESHELSQGISASEGSYWHAIAHRVEPDASNSAYWFRRVGEHPIFAQLHEVASGILERRDVGWRLKSAWDPFLFIEWCDEARRAAGTDKDQVALKIQRAEWDLLFEWCAVEPVAYPKRSRATRALARAHANGLLAALPVSWRA
jgi:hypothetical protein